MAAHRLAAWVITPNGYRLAQTLSRRRSKTDLYVSANLDITEDDTVTQFAHLAGAMARCFRRYHGHLFIMATGIVVRLVARHLRGKAEDPAVVVMDDAGTHVISLLSGHMGGGNRLTHEIAAILGAEPVVTTATDVNAKPAIDVLAVDLGLRIDNPQNIKVINMALLTEKPIALYDPYRELINRLPATLVRRITSSPHGIEGPCIRVDDVQSPAGSNTLILRPQSLAVGIGCNRNTVMAEIKDFVERILDQYRLSLLSLRSVASIDVKADEAGLLELAAEFDVPLTLFSRHELNAVDSIANPSSTVQGHVGAKSVCEAAAILAADSGQLIVPKQKSLNVTVAIARKCYPS